MPRGTTLLPGGATQLSGGATPPPRGAPLSKATQPPGEILRQHLGQLSRGSVWKKEIRSQEGVPPLGRVAPLGETPRLGREGPPREARSRKEAPRLKLKLLMKSVLVLLPALMQADKSQLKENYLQLGSGEVCITSTGDDSPEEQGVTKVASPTSRGVAAATPYG